jgi:hypothetical protein
MRGQSRLACVAATPRDSGVLAVDLDGQRRQHVSASCRDDLAVMCAQAGLEQVVVRALQPARIVRSDLVALLVGVGAGAILNGRLAIEHRRLVALRVARVRRHDDLLVGLVLVPFQVSAMEDTVGHAGKLQR